MALPKGWGVGGKKEVHKKVAFKVNAQMVFKANHLVIQLCYLCVANLLAHIILCGSHTSKPDELSATMLSCCGEKEGDSTVKRKITWLINEYTIKKD